jgi:hypothetical protein
MSQPTASQSVQRHSVFSDHILRSATQHTGVLCNLPIEVFELILSHLKVGHPIVLGLTCKQVAKSESIQDVHSKLSSFIENTTRKYTTLCCGDCENSFQKIFSCASSVVSLLRRTRRLPIDWMRIWIHQKFHDWNNVNTVANPVTGTIAVTICHIRYSTDESHRM